MKVHREGRMVKNVLFCLYFAQVLMWKYRQVNEYMYIYIHQQLLRNKV